jgi:hypothetical protein
MPEGLSVSINPITNLITVRVNIGEIAKDHSPDHGILAVGLAGNLAGRKLGETLKNVMNEESKKKLDVYGMIVPYRVKLVTEGLGSKPKRYDNRDIDVAAKADLKEALTAFEVYHFDHGTYPDSIEKVTGAEYGFFPSEKVRVIVESADSKTYTLRSYHEQSKHEFVVHGPKDILDIRQERKR